MPQFHPSQNTTFIRALLRQPTEYTPVWLMRQAGRYLPEYRASRGKAGSFMGLCTNPDLACEVTLQPLERYPLDAAILFSDILTVPDAMGLGLRFVEGEGPVFDKPVRTEADVLALQLPQPEALAYVPRAVATIRQALDGRVPLIGFSGSPWTLACYMVEGCGGSEFRTIKTMLYQRPDLLHHILNITTHAVIDYLQSQIDAGAQCIMLFDSWGGVLADGAFQAFSLQYMQRIIAALPRTVWRGEVGSPGAFEEPIPSIVFTKGGGLWLDALANTGASALGVDWTVNLGQAKAQVGSRCALQGNIDPMVLFAKPGDIEAEVKRTLDAFGPVTSGFGHVFNLGHGISQFTNPEHVHALVDTVHEYSRGLHA